MAAVDRDDVFADGGPEPGHGRVGDAGAVRHHGAKGGGEGQVREAEGVGEEGVESERGGEEGEDGEGEGCEEVHC